MSYDRNRLADMCEKARLNKHITPHSIRIGGNSTAALDAHWRQTEYQRSYGGRTGGWLTVRMVDPVHAPYGPRGNRADPAHGPSLRWAGRYLFGLQYKVQFLALPSLRGIAEPISVGQLSYTAANGGGRR